MRRFRGTNVVNPAYISAFRVADMNGDGRPDLVVSDNNGPFVRVLLGTGPGVFAPDMIFSVPEYIVDVEVGDFNGDSMTDVAVTGDGGGGSILLGNGTGALGSRMDVTSPRLETVTAVDLDNDLRLDLVGGHYYSPSSLQILLNRGCAPARDRPPHVIAPRSASTPENAVVTLNVTATDPDGESIAQLRADVSALPLG